MEGSEVTLKIKHTSDKVVEVKISTEATVAELKEAISQATSIKANEQKIIFKGKILKDEDILSSYKVEDGSAMHVVQTKGAPNQVSTSQQSTGGTSNSNVPTNLQTGGFGLLNSLGFPTANTNSTGGQQSPFNNPMFTSMFQSILSNPSMLQSMIQNNPMLRQMVENNPEVQQALNDPAMLQMMADPQVIQAAMGMMGRMGQGGTGTMSGTDFPMPGGETTTSTTSTTSTTNTNSQSGGTSTTNTQPNPFGMFGGMGGGMGGGMSGGFPNYMQMMQNMQGMFGQPNQSQSTQSPSTQSQGTTSQSGGTTGTSTNPNTNFNPFMGGFPGFGSPFGFPFGGGFGQQNQQQNQQTQQQENIPLEEKYKDQLQQLETMGFINKEVNIQMLKSTNGNVNAAVERLLNMLG